MEFEAAEAGYATWADTLTPEALFERRWALGVIDRALAALRAECVSAGKGAVFDGVKDLIAGEKAPGGYASIAQGLGLTEGALKVTIHRLRRRFRHLLRADIAATVADASEIDDEIRHLIAIVGEHYKASSLG